MSKCLLHKNRLDAFKLWLTENGIEHREGKGDYQVLQVKSHDGKNWNAVYVRHDMPEHLTCVRYLDSLVLRFCRISREQKRQQNEIDNHAKGL